MFWDQAPPPEPVAEEKVAARQSVDVPVFAGVRV